MEPFQRWPFISVFLFVGAAILTAWLYVKWISPADTEHTGPEATLSSQTTLKEQFEGLWKKGQQARKQLTQAESEGFLEAQKCNCTREPFDSPTFQIDAESSCQKPQRVQNLEFEKSAPVYRDPRSRRPAEFPRLCLLPILRRSCEPKRGLASEEACGSSCVTDVALNVHYNLFGDVTSCFEIPQKDFLPAFDRLVKTPLWLGEFDFQEMKSFLATQESDSCRKLSQHLQGRSGFADPHLLPLTASLLQFGYLARVYRSTLQELVAHYRISVLLKAAKIEVEESEQIEQILLPLSFEAGAWQAVLLLKNYLQARLVAADKAGHFQDYLEKYQSSGSSKILLELKEKALTLNHIFKEGTCVSESYLSLSL